MTASTLTDASGNYQFSGLSSGGSYIVTPSKAALLPATVSINTVDVIATQRHFLNVASLPPGCRQQAADANSDTAINTIDVVAIQRFYLGLSTGVANVGKYQFSPTSRAYLAIENDATDQNYNTYVVGDVTAPFAARMEHPSPAGETMRSEARVAADEILLPLFSLDQSKTRITVGVTTSDIDVRKALVGFQGDILFDERVVIFGDPPIQKAGLTIGNWNVSGNVLQEDGPMRRLRVSAFSTDFTPLSGGGTLFQMNMIRVGGAGDTELVWSRSPSDFVFIDVDLHTLRPGLAPPGRAVVTPGRRQ